jgi:hypothetical protein
LLIRAAKTSYTAGTLCDIWKTPNFSEKAIDKNQKEPENNKRAALHGGAEG